MFAQVLGFEFYLGQEPTDYFGVSIHVGKFSLECQRTALSSTRGRSNQEAVHGCTDGEAVSSYQCCASTRS